MATTIHATANIEQPTAAQEHFTENYDLDRPIEAIHNYARIMHLHTKRQMDMAYRAANRRGDNDTVPAVAQLSSAESTGTSDGSIDSRA